ncbi:hypothetical protein RBH29_17100 [Herbivorax sp. ANBcel31]|uniref:hypothetical protein n=1 Tax=Herbivorax sp. ANBcel31 TaxID=3069754 RepID=UPI0027B493AA|nr:hypothetical protein [Herbivorax sp. ANBcel31]MDQ2088145.1 hypothetical protein [Herbivorax sp. ANBcel31]
MKSEIKDLILYLDSEDFDEKNIAISEVASLLEMNTYILNGGKDLGRLEEYKIYLDEDLISIRLDIGEQAEIIDELIKRIRSKDELRSSMLWAIGKGRPEAGLVRLAETIKACWDEFNDEEAYQSIVSMENYMDYDVKETLSKEEEIIRFLKNKSEAVDQRLWEVAKRVLSKLLKV